MRVHRLGTVEPEARPNQTPEQAAERLAFIRGCINKYHAGVCPDTILDYVSQMANDD